MREQPDYDRRHYPTFPQFLKGGSVIVAIAFVGLLVMMVTLTGPFKSVSGTGVTAAEANKHLHWCPVPANATDVGFTSNYRLNSVECTLDQTSFSDWCRKRGWRPIPVTPAKPVIARSESDEFITVTNGQAFEADIAPNGGGYRGIYDSKNFRAYVIYSTR